MQNDALRSYQGTPRTRGNHPTYPRPHSQRKNNRGEQARTSQAVENRFARKSSPVDSFIQANYYFFLQEGLNKQEAFNRFEALIKDYPLIEKVKAIKSLISFLDDAGVHPLKSKHYQDFGNFFFRRIVLSSCNDLSHQNPKEASQSLVSLFNSIRFLLDFRKGILLSGWQDEYSTVAAVLITLARKNYLCKVRHELLGIAQLENNVGKFFRKLFLEGGLGGRLAVNKCHPALDIGAFAILLLGDAFAINWYLKLEEEEKESYFKGLAFNRKDPEELIQKINEKIEDPQVKAAFEETVAEYKNNFTRRSLRQKEKEEAKCAKMQAVLKQFSSIRFPVKDQTQEKAKIAFCQPPIPPIASLPPQILSIADLPLKVRENDRENLKLLEPLSLPPLTDAASILANIYSGNEPCWRRIVKALDNLFASHPAEAEKIKIEIAEALIKNQWKNELKQFIETYLPELPEELWKKIIVLSKKGAKDSLARINLLLEIFITEKEGNLTLYFREQFLRRLSGYEKMILSPQEGKLLAQIIETVFETFNQFPPGENLSNLFISLCSTCFSGKKKKVKKSVLDLTQNAGDKIVYYNLCYLSNNVGLIEPDAQIARAAKFEAICRHRELSSTEEEIVLQILAQINLIFKRWFQSAGLEERRQYCKSYQKFIPLVANAKYIKILNSTYIQIPWLITRCYYEITMKNLDPKYPLKDLLSLYPAIFSTSSLHENGNSNRLDLIHLSQAFYEMLLKFYLHEDSAILKDLLLYIYAYDLFPLNIPEIIEKFVNNGSAFALHAALTIVNAFLPLEQNQTKIVNLDLLIFLIQPLLEVGKESPNKNWCVDLKCLSDLIHSNFYVGQDKDTRKKAKEALKTLANGFLASRTPASDYFYYCRSLLRLGKGVDKQFCFGALLGLNLSADLTLKNYKENSGIEVEIGLIYGRIAPFYLARSSDSEAVSHNFNQCDQKIISIINDDFKTIFNKKTKKRGRAHKPMAGNDSKHAFGLAEMFSFHMAALGLRNSGKPIDFGVEVWDRFCSIPCIKRQLSEAKETSQIQFQTIFQQAQLSMGTALMNCRGDAASFDWSYEKLKSVLCERIVEDNFYIALQLYRQLFMSLLKGFGKDLEPEERKEKLNLLLDEKIVKLLLLDTEYMIKLIPIFMNSYDEIAKENSDQSTELAGFLWEKISLLIEDVKYRKMILDHWSNLAEKHEITEQIMMIKSFMNDLYEIKKISIND